ncbi:MAG TPA: hypothetical protein PK404_05525 [Fervidobacterium sp.]|nr:hypothetical protein [Fervidobacterium sp.]HOM74686.1 hypothetical protein [Fervidobacterium sp.]HPP18218.1 hypothetical protein [Fervidobacterium sp.]
MKTKHGTILFVLTIVQLLSINLLFGDDSIVSKLILNNETIFIGTIEKCDSGMLTLKTRYGTLEINQEDIRYILLQANEQIDEMAREGNSPLIRLRNGDRISGIMERYMPDEGIILKTTYGEAKIKNISDVKYVVVYNKTEKLDEETTWQHEFGGYYDDEAYSIARTSDGAYVIAGYTKSIGSGDCDVYVLKLDNDGRMLWSKTLGGVKDDWAYSVEQTDDGGCIVAGETKSFGCGKSDFYISKFDSDGNCEWQKTFGGYDDDWALSVKQTSDGGYIVAGYTLSFGAGKGDVCILKLDNEGYLEWWDTFGGKNDDWAYSVLQADDGGYVIAGYTYSFGTGGDIYVLKLDSEGTLEWQHVFGGKSAERGYSIDKTQDGGYLVAGYTKSFTKGGTDVYILKLDKNGNLEWHETYGGREDDWAREIHQTSTGNIIVVGATYSFGNGKSDVLVLSLDSDGTLLWDKTFGDVDDEWGRSICETVDGGYIATGYTKSFGYNEKDVYVVKLDDQHNFESVIY